MLEPCFASKHHQISQRLSKVLLKLYQAMGEPKQEQPNQQLMVSKLNISAALVSPAVSVYVCDAACC